MASNLQKRKLRHSMPTFRSSCPLTLWGTSCHTVQPEDSQSLWAVLVNFWEGCGEGEKYFLIWTLEEDSWLPCSQHSYESAAQGIANSYPSVFLNLPVMRKLPAAALVNSLKTGKGYKTSFCSLECLEDGIFPWHLAMRQEVIVLIHPNWKKRRQEL